jgi:hypothetical protein
MVSFENRKVALPSVGICSFLQEYVKIISKIGRMYFVI